MLRHFKVLTEAAIQRPDDRISRLPLLDNGEIELLDAWSHGPRVSSKAGCVHEFVLSQADRTPGKTAVSYGDEHLTFGELAERSAKLALHLQSIDVGSGDLVGIYLQRTPATVIALLGVLRAGAAYVPLDPSYPSERIAFMMGDAKVKVILTSTELAQSLPKCGAQVIRLDKDDWMSTPAKPAAANRPASPDSLAYVMYTSGSTGTPKGVRIPHRCVVNLLTSLRQAPGLGPDDVLLSITTLSFDISVLEIFLPLTVGAHLVLAGPDVAGDGQVLKRHLETVKPTFLQATPATWRILIHSGWRGDRRMKGVAAGEAWGWDLASPMLESCSSVWNGYGPTETTVYASMRALNRDEGRVHMGGAIANGALYVLDENRQRVPIGVPGELYIGGAGVGDGYLNRPELTDEKFVSSPFDSSDKSRLYRSGDRVRYCSDGTIEFLGRIDHQIKLRGFRIEPGEIQSALVKFSGVKQAVVVLREDRPGDQRLVAYLLTDGRELAPPSEMRAFLRQYLPDYMLPNQFVRLEAFPLTPSGKIDRKALPAPDPNSAPKDDASGKPASAIEEQVASMFADVLGCKSVGVLDNFFEIGGHSLLATQVVARIRSSFGIELSLIDFFDEPTVAGLARRLDATLGSMPDTEGNIAVDKRDVAEF
jgi:amino acid adenylation domain-containing protein